jgi:DNA-binding response OmpR family regulator
MPEPTTPAAYRVMIVPHCTNCGESLRMLLSVCGFHAEVVRGGDAAVRRALELLPQTVLVFINLPGEDGWKVGRWLRASLGDAVQLIGLAPIGWKGDPAAWREAGFDGWLQNPVSPDDLFSLLGKGDILNKLAKQSTSADRRRD